MLSDLLSVEDALMPVIHSYNGLAHLIYESDISNLNSEDLGALLFSVNRQLQTVLDDLAKGREARLIAKGQGVSDM
jgi:hypothetical protein